jgi:DNA-binding CsgD family transcriptional regulator
MVGVLARGVRVRTIYAGDAFRLPGYASYMAEAGRLGERARLLAHLPMRFVVSDRGAAVLPLVADGPWVGSALVVRGHSLVEDLVNVFDDLWERATDLDAGTGEAAAASRDVDEQESALLRMLAADMTESAIARHLGMSTRTVGRRIAVVQRKLGARTRFGLGAESARRGLV